MSWNEVGAHFFILRRWPKIPSGANCSFSDSSDSSSTLDTSASTKWPNPRRSSSRKARALLAPAGRLRRNAFLDLTTHFGPNPLTKHDWEQPGVDTLGLSWEENEATAGIQVIAAFVAKGTGRAVAGVLSIEAPAQTLAEPPVRTVDCLQDPDTGRYVGGLADTIADKLGR